MTAFRIYLVFLLAGLMLYTALVGANHGWNLLPVFFGDIAAMTWPGQFNLDFLTFLSLSALWVAWRHQFNAAGILVGVVAFFGGMVFLAAYLLVASIKSEGDMKRLLLGPARVGP